MCKIRTVQPLLFAIARVLRQVTTPFLFCINQEQAVLHMIWYRKKEMNLCRITHTIMAFLCHTIQ